MQMSRALSALFAAMVSIAVFAAPSDQTKTEIGHLFSYLKSSGCKFNRNGKWYAAEAASKHLQTKYDYLVSEGLITSTESFIELGATESSASGKPYRVQCAGSAPVESATWFRAELSRLRAANPNRR
ncbi:MAG: DUF5329 domain-containing protein [Burkholderiaceae bacterium]